ncbi:hypothetical protein MNV49_007923 [Pseudohyphozyma bogoriensis]|nr:hypothetical protein MNV49_007923 [Pseudohyphozyma bogoriensis]
MASARFARSSFALVRPTSTSSSTSSSPLSLFSSPQLPTLSSTPATYLLSQSSRFPVSNARETASTSARHFSSSASALASEAPQSPFGGDDHAAAAQPLFDRLQNHPQVLEAITNLANLAKAKTGVDLQNGDRPSLKLMWTMANDAELKEAAENLMRALQDAGIRIDPGQAFQALKAMGGEGFQGVNNLGEVVDKKGGKKGDDE